MKEREVRARIEEFLRITVRRVVVPASLGLGFTGSGCDSNALRARGRDASPDVASQVADAGATTNTRDAAAELPFIAPPYLAPLPPPDMASSPDLPLMAIPYIVALPPDAALDESRDTFESEAAAPDAGADAYVPVPPLIYNAFMQSETGSAAKRAITPSSGEAAARNSQQKA